MTRKLLSTMTVLMLGLTASAQGFDNLPDPIEDVNKVVDNTPDSIAKALMSRPAPGSSRKGNHPVLYLIGNSTMRNGTKGNGSNGQWGWGYFANKYFDESKITVENQALGGMSTRTFYTDLWPAVRDALKPGDWVIVSIGHNDNGEFFDQKRARAVIPGVDPDTLYVGFNQRTQKTDTVYSYGAYLHRYISEIRAKGANPILMSLTPRDAYDDKGKIVRKPHSMWAAYMAAVEGVPYVDLNERSGQKLDSYSHWKEQYHFLGDKIHTSKFGAEMNARSAAEGLWESQNPQLKPLQAMMKNVEPEVYRVDRSSGKPAVFFTGDSTVKNADKEEDGMWGWAAQASTVFDESKITLVNAARAGRSTRSFIREGLWDKVYNSLQPGDFVTIQFGHNDICPITDAKARGVIPGTKDTLHVYHLDNDTYEVVYSFGWYLKKMIDDVREKGATPILVSLTPRNEWPGGKVERRDDSYGRWYREVVAETGVEFVDMHNISADFLDKKFAVKKLPADKAKAQAKMAQIKEKAGAKYFKKDHTHASKLGAQMNAQSMAKGLRANASELAKYLKKK
ncbi:GDSL-type esterase/lipase family protein [Prevotella sp. E13-17]|uniref:GDSL-type esterase/lipase family protein n=1 Tax=Prevotella sp. E13-17 TaxID=2913616 RepID=UPI001EDB26F0|nr:GDSL-type esterase/lipase family protein [Prevotella sp. E13-17]UKK51743.1 GDSL-type esterase/lipase family protein [Prevotella sp. E13-17]